MAAGTSTSKKVEDVVASRIDEDYILQQRDRTTTESLSEWKDRINEVLSIASGDLTGTRTGRMRNGAVGVITPTADTSADELVVENIIKNAILDMASLATEAVPTIQAVQRGSTEEARRNKVMREAIAHTVLWAGRFERLRQTLYIDAIKSGVMAVAAYWNDRSPYAQFARLDPVNCYPSVRNGKLMDMLVVEKVKFRHVVEEFPDMVEMKGYCDDEIERIDLYDKDETVKAYVFTKDGKVPRDGRSRVVIADRWEHGYGRPTVAFEQVDTVDGHFRGLMDQAKGPFTAKNAIVTYLMEYIEDMVHAPLEEKNILGGAEDQQPGPNTIYHHDPNASESFIRRVPPAAPAGAVFGLTQFLETQIAGEVQQPPARQGNVRQSIATGSFVDKTQGRLTSVVKNLQDLMGFVIEDLVECLYFIEKKELNQEKPLWQPVGRKYTYVPSEDIGDWTYIRVEHGAAAGLDRSSADIRIQSHLGARLIPKSLARQEIDYLRGQTDIQDQIDRETAAEARMQRFASDPQVPISSLIKFELAIAEGKTSIEALKAALPEIEAQEKAMREAQNPQAQVPAPEGLPEGADAEATAPGQEELLPLNLARPPLQQQILRVQQ